MRDKKKNRIPRPLEKSGTPATGALLTVEEVSKQLRVDATTVRRWIKNGAMDAVSLPHSDKRQSYRIRQATLDALLATSAI